MELNLFYLSNIIETLSEQLHFQGRSILYFYHVVCDIHSICKNVWYTTI